MPNYKSIIDPNTDSDKDTVKREANLIITSVVLGFAGVRYYQKQPCSFEVEWETPPEEYYTNKVRDENGQTYADRWDQKNQIEQQDFASVMACLSDVLDRYEPGMGSWLSDGQSQKTGKGKSITGRSGGSITQSKYRDKTFQSWKTDDLVKQLSDKSWLEDEHGESKQGIYVGNGAYSGICDDPIELLKKNSEEDKENVRPTLRVYRADVNWLPETQAEPYGIIGGRERLSEEEKRDLNLSEQQLVTLQEERPYYDDEFNNLVGFSEEQKARLKKRYNNTKKIKDFGMGEFPGDLANQKLGYIHGMSSAIHLCKIHGGWSTPYEVATGNYTTKIASCFACTTYMYATGYPPSSSHLGRGESWVPPISEDFIAVNQLCYPVEIKPNEPITASKHTFKKKICDSYKTLWDSDIRDYMVLGAKIISEGKIRQEKRVAKLFKDEKNIADLIEPITIMKQEYVDILNTLLIFLNVIVNVDENEREISQRFLDALTIHDSDWKRIKETFYPLYQRKRIKELKISGMVQKRRP